MHETQQNPIAAIPTESPAYRVTPVGIEFLAEIDQEEWNALGQKLGSAGRTIGFLIGDWLNYGDGKVEEGVFPKSEGGVYHDAIAITGLDYNTLATYAGVTRKVPRSIRVERLSFKRHRKVAPLKTDEEKRKWLQIALQERDNLKGKPMSSRRLEKSIRLGRVATVEDMSVPAVDRRRENITFYVTRIIVLFGKFKRNGVVKAGDTDTILNLMDELRPVVDIFQELADMLAQGGGGGLAGSHNG